jgi:hypothetical protein
LTRLWNDANDERIEGSKTIYLIVFCEALGDQRQRLLGFHVLDDYPEWLPGDLDRFISGNLIEELEND